MAPLEDKPRIEERVGRALASGDLRQNALAPCDLDKVIALGMVGITERIADAVFRVKYANDPKEFDNGLEGVYRLSRALDARLRWRYKRRRLKVIARRVFTYWLMDVCPLCTGVRYVPVSGTARLSDVACPACHGEGKREMPWMKLRLPREPEGIGHGRASKERWARWHRRRLRVQEYQHRHKALLCELEALERVIGDKMVRKLAAEVRSISV
jgi:hypothetical protein